MRNHLLLDTCALVWLASGDARLSSFARGEIDAAQSVSVSAISAWEISLKVVRAELELPMAPLPWFQRALSVHRLALANLTPEAMVAANELPWHHRDPADRFIIATALQQGWTVVTTDARFADYGVPVIG